MTWHFQQQVWRRRAEGILHPGTDNGKLCSKALPAVQIQGWSYCLGKPLGCYSRKGRNLFNSKAFNLEATISFIHQLYRRGCQTSKFLGASTNIPGLWKTKKLWLVSSLAIAQSLICTAPDVVTRTARTQFPVFRLFTCTVPLLVGWCLL